MWFLGFIIGLIAGAVSFGSSYWYKSDAEKNAPERNIKTAIKKGVTLWLVIWFVGVTIGFFADLYTDYTLFNELGYVSTWTTRLTLNAGIFALTFVIVAIWLALNAYVVKQLIPVTVWQGFTKSGHYRYDRDEEIPAASSGFKWLQILLIAIGALTLAWIATWGWETILKYANQVQFGVTDPIIGQDISIYTFTMPFLHWVKNMTFWSILAGAVVGTAVLVYGFYRAEESSNEEIRAKILKAALAFGSVILGLVVLTWAWDLSLEKNSLLYAGHSSLQIVGAGKTDVSVRMPILSFVPVLVVIASLALFSNLFLKKWQVLAGTVGTLVAIWLILLVGWPTLVEIKDVSPTAQDVERPYVQNHIDFTRQAYDLNKVKEFTFNYSQTLTKAELQANNATLSQMRIMDWRPLDDNNDAWQEKVTYYDFVDVDLDRYHGVEMMVSARELNQDQLPEAARRSWQNSHLQYTHGYGVTAAAVNKTDADGLPSYIASEIPVTGDESFQLEHPEIYYGQLTNNWVIVNTTLPEFGQPSNDGNPVSYSYSGSGGISLGGINRLMFVMRFMDWDLLLNMNIKPDSKLLWRRQISERISSIAPFLYYDADPYVVACNDRLFFMQDAYTQVSNYPYAEAMGNGNNYIRNAVKVTVDAFDGTTKFYITDSTDPVIKTWQNAFPGMFRPLSEMNGCLQEHIRYPEGLFHTQSVKFGKFHVTDPLSFLNNSDLWVLPQENYLDQGAQEMEPRFVMMQLPGESQLEFVEILSYTPYQKENQIGWIASRMGEHYGELLYLRFPKTPTVPGPVNIENLINQKEGQLKTDIFQWTSPQSKSKILWGNMIIIPVQGEKTVSLVTIKPLFLVSTQAEGRGKIPALKWVIIYANGELIYEKTLDAALARLYGKALPTPQTPVDATPEEVNKDVNGFAQEVLKHFLQAQACFGQGDMACYASEWEKGMQMLKKAAGQGQ